MVPDGFLMLLQCFLDAFFPGHRRQFLDFIQITFQTFGYPFTVIFVGFKEYRRLVKLKPFLGVAEMRHDIADKMVAVGFGHHLTVQQAGLFEIAVGMVVFMAVEGTESFPRRVVCLAVRRCSTLRVGIVVGCAAAVVIGPYESVALVDILGGILRLVDRNQVVVTALL